jgi:hypothetical protein
MKLIKKLQTLWFYSFIIFGIGILLELKDNQLNVGTLLIFIMYSVLYYLASTYNEKESKTSNH